MIWFSLALAAPVGPDDDLAAVLASSGPTVTLELGPGEYVGLDLLLEDQQVELVGSGLVVFRASRFDLRSGSLALRGVRVVEPAGDAFLVGDGASLDLSEVVLELGRAGRAVLADGEVTGADVTVQGGLGERGGQFHQRAGSLVLTRVELSGGEALQGGAIRVEAGASLELTAASLRLNRATDGGALSCAGVCEVHQSRLLENLVVGRGGAVQVDAGAVLRLHRSDVFRNQSTAGGGLHALAPSELSIERSTLCANRALGEAGQGGGVWLEDPGEGSHLAWTRLIDNDAGEGGGLYLSGTPPVLQRLNLIGNGAFHGAAVLATERLPLEDSLVGWSRLDEAVVTPSWTGRGSRFFANLSGNAEADVDLLSYELPLIEPHVYGSPCEVPRDFYAGTSAAVEHVRGGRQEDAFGSEEEVGAYLMSGEGEPGGHPAGLVDADRDGWMAAYDCDDGASDVFPRTTEAVYGDGIDDACDGGSDDDRDGDGYDEGEDCDDTRADVNPGAPDRDPLVDRDCDGFVLDDVPDLESAPCGSRDPGGSPVALLLLTWTFRRRSASGATGYREPL